MKTYGTEEELLKKFASEKNSNENFGKRMQYLLREKINNPDSFTPNYKNVYETLIKYSSSLSPHQAYAMTFFLGMDSSKGYKTIPGKADFTLPQDDAPQWDYQLVGILLLEVVLEIMEKNMVYSSCSGNIHSYHLK